MFFNYILLNKINNKRYVGYTDNVRRRWSQEKRAAYNTKNKNYEHPLSRAIRKYGWDNFTKKIVGQWETKKEALEYESFLIEYYNTNINKYGNKYGYNLTNGGEDLGGKNNPMYGKNHTDETKRKISNANKGKPSQNIGIPLSDETKLKISIANSGKIRTDETKQKLSIANSGINNPFYGKTHSKDSIEQMKNTLSVMMSGENNPFFGKNHTEESKTKMSLSKIGKKSSQETKEKLSIINSGKGNPFYGKKHTDESKIKMRDDGYFTKLTKVQVSEIKKALINGVSRTELAALYNVSKSNIGYIELGKTWKDVEAAQ